MKKGWMIRKKEQLNKNSQKYLKRKENCKKYKLQKLQKYI